MSALTVSRDAPAAVAVVGLGSVGRALMAQLEGLVRTTLPVRLVALSNSRRTHVAAGGIDPGRWEHALEQEGGPPDLDALAGALASSASSSRVVLDLTASAAVAGLHHEWLARGLHVVTANKLAAAGAEREHRKLHAAARRGQARYLTSATVGAGLPVLHVLARLHAAGDRVRRIRGILSGSLAYAFLNHDGTTPFSALLRRAHALGLTEPDPRADLGGMDVARKLVIAARAAGLTPDPARLVIEDLVTDALRGGSVEEFLAASPLLDAPLEQRRRAAASCGAVLRHVGSVTRDGVAWVGLVEVGSEDPLAQIAAGDNCVEIVSDRYRDNPLVIRGAGAGPAVTASAVLADLAEVAAQARQR